MIARLVRYVIRQLIAVLPLRGIRYLHRLTAQRLPPDELKDMIMISIREQTHRLDAKTSLRFLFNLEAEMYPLKSHYAVQYDNGVHTKHRHMNYHRFFTDRIDKTEHVIDIGCGIGALAYSIAKETDATVLGLDYDENNIRIAKERFQADNINYIVADAYHYQPEEVFDVVVMSNVLEHLNHRPSLLLRIQEQTQAKRFLIRVPRFDRHWSIPLKKELGVEWRLDVDHKTEFTPETFRDEMAEAQLKIEFIDFRWDEIWAELRVIDSSMS